MNKKKIMKIQKQIAQIQSFASSINSSEHDLAMFFFLSNDLLLISDADGYIKFSNKNLYDTMGFNPAELVGTKFIELIHPNDLDITLEFRKRLIEGTPIRNLTASFKHKDGQYIKISWNAIRVKNGTVYSCGKIEEEKNESK